MPLLDALPLAASQSNLLAARELMAFTLAFHIVLACSWYYIRPLPEPTLWFNAWFAFAGPGWVIFSGTKQVIGVFLAVYLLVQVDPTLGHRATEPVKQFVGMYQTLIPDWLAIVLALVLIVIAQVKINVIEDP